MLNKDWNSGDVFYRCGVCGQGKSKKSFSQINTSYSSKFGKICNDCKTKSSLEKFRLTKTF